LQHLLGQIYGPAQKKLVLSEDSLARIHQTLKVRHDLFYGLSLVRVQEWIDVQSLARRGQLALGSQQLLGLASSATQNEEFLNRNPLSR
jgi:hypothetical protein